MAKYKRSYGWVGQGIKSTLKSAGEVMSGKKQTQLPVSGSKRWFETSGSATTWELADMIKRERVERTQQAVRQEEPQYSGGRYYGPQRALEKWMKRK